MDEHETVTHKIAIVAEVTAPAGSSIDELKDALDIFGRSLREGGLGDIVGLFDLMAIAEDEIAVASAAHPEQAALMNRCFGMLLPTPYVRLERLYRPHCRELLERVLGGFDVRPGTKAEAVGVLMNLSYVSPLSSHAVTLYARLFCEMMPDQWATWDILDLEAMERREGEQADELLNDIRRRVQNRERRLGEALQTDSSTTVPEAIEEAMSRFPAQVTMWIENEATEREEPNGDRGR